VSNIPETQQIQVSKEMLLGELMARFPKATEVFAKFGVKTAGCSTNPFDTLEQFAKAQGKDEAAISEMVASLNKAMRGISLDSQFPISLTETGATHVKQIMQSEGKAGWVLKVTAVPGGCSGFMYEMDFVQSPGSDHEIVEMHGLKICYDKAFEHVLKGTIIDFKEGLQGTGFVMNNPNAKSGCGCGQSFSA
jgi:iron-sulfur cluster assembly accessory protein